MLSFKEATGNCSGRDSEGTVGVGAEVALLGVYRDLHVTVEMCDIMRQSLLP